VWSYRLSRLLLDYLKRTCSLDWRALTSLSTLVNADTSFRGVFILTQRVGYKSGNVMKLLACVRMYVPLQWSDNRYAALLSVENIRKEVLKKLLSMLLHPLPRVGHLIAKL